MQLETTIATAGGTTTLTVSSFITQIFTGTLTQICALPTTSVVGGQIWTVINQSTGAVTVKSSNGNTVLVIGGGRKAIFTALQNTPTTSAHWHAQYVGDLVTSGKTFAVTNSLTLAGVDGKTLTVDNSLELAGTDSTKMTFPGTTDTVATLAALQTLTNTTLGLLRISTALSSLSTLTLTTADSIYVYTGSSTATWTLPSVSGNTGMVLFLSNRGSATVTIQRAGSDNIYDATTGSVTSITMPAGASFVLINDATYWITQAIDLANNVAGILPAANGGTGQSSLTSLTLTTPTIDGYTEAVQALGTVGSTQTIGALSTGTMVTSTLTTATPCTFTMPTAAAGLSFLHTVRQPASGSATTATWTGVKWPAAGAPTITATLGKCDVLSFFCYDGTNWYGTYVQGYTY